MREDKVAVTIGSKLQSSYGASLVMVLQPNLDGLMPCNGKGHVGMDVFDNDEF